MLSVLRENLNWIIIAGALLGGAWLNARGKSGEALEYYERANRTLAEQNRELMHDHKEYLAQIADLKRKTDFETALAPVLQAIQKNDGAAQKRHIESMTVFNMIAAKIGPEE